MTARWRVWAVTAVGAAVIASGVGYAATYTDGSPGQLSLNAGDATHVHCPTQVGVGNVTGQDFDATCAPASTTTTVDPPTTTTVDPPTTTTLPAPTTTTVPQTTTTVPAPPSAFPDATNTGVPAGVTLTNWSGSTTISTCQTITGKNFPNGVTVTATNGTHSSATPCVTISNSKIAGVAFVSYSGAGPTVLRSDEIVGKAGSTTPPLWQYNFYGYSLNVHGGRGQVDCDGYCELHDSYVHNEDYAGATHMQAFETNGQTAGGTVLLDHNTFWCNPAGSATGGGGCAADVSFFGDSANVNGSTVTNNLFKASTGQFGYCVYTGGFEASKPYGTGTNLTWTGNTFERGRSGKCGDAGPVADWEYNAGNVWANNHWDDGTALNV